MFLGLCNVYISFVSSFERLAASLNRKLKKGELLQFQLEKSERQAVEALKEK